MSLEAPSTAALSARWAAFPSLVIRADGYEPQGAFAEAQAMYLDPDPGVVAALRAQLVAANAGVVAHFYMDAELQGTLAALDYPHVFVADSLMMAEAAVKMARAGAAMIFVLGVDFMTENVRATLDASGFSHVPVYRVAERNIGCSLAEAAEAQAYAAYLERAAQTPRSLHVIYVNTSLRVKGYAATRVPTITCTSSNVLPLLLQAYAQVPGLQVFFGPDTYMGHNLAQMLQAFASLDDTAIKRLHPGHDAASLRSAAERFRYFEQGSCVVHHMFGHSVVERVRRDYADAFVTAHLEVPGEMFTLGFDAQRQGRGVVGSTSNILEFILARVREAAAQHAPARMRFILGTESGMVTSVARQVRQALRDANAGPDIAAEIVFPVASEAIASTGERELPIVPGVAGGEGCTTAGGCASCPYMKMSSLDGLNDALRRVLDGGSMASYAPKTLTDPVLAARGRDSIEAMRALQRDKRLPDALVAAIEAHGAAA